MKKNLLHRTKDLTNGKLWYFMLKNYTKNIQHVEQNT
jgi:hypothetical protein